MMTDVLDERLGARLLNEWQQDFPLCPAPFAELASKLGVAETAVLRMLERLRREGRIARVGAVFAPKRIGASSLAAMAVPADKLARVTEAVNRFPEVNQNYVRQHFYNFWFVVTAGSPGRLQAALGAIEQAAGLPVLRLPMVSEYRRDDDRRRSVSADTDGVLAAGLDEIGRRLVMALQEGLPFFIRPFSVLASRVGCEEREVIERIRRWSDEGAIKRFGVVVRRRASDREVKALLVMDVPDAEVGSVSRRLLDETGVILVDERERALPAWPYNLFCTVGAPSEAALIERLDALRGLPALSGFVREVLLHAPEAPAA
ncbi:Lrp/AsnC family transcriptional regulator [Propionivibrio dicarboxylicus]|uniref:siroheme decarboxylase n=1 Tax=Propionivibrio dicarboxylicus TaxID=83767 RepID=A0A1G8JEX2_9RHOO|nr:Lrp/AsnC family transcriptional regulator [Propionivibrio dicarboxylicus]SDI29755.1 DNA-binding transcriptional regulator, Lrp family [Propionivibrio dicarboxylicus]